MAAPKLVVVEKGNKRRIERPGEAKTVEAAAAAPPPGNAARRPWHHRPPRRRRAAQERRLRPHRLPSRPQQRRLPRREALGVVLRTLTKEEQDRRAHALGDAKVREAEERKIAEEEAKIRAEARFDRAAPSVKPLNRRKRTEDERRRHDEGDQAQGRAKSPRSASVARKKPRKAKTIHDGDAGFADGWTPEAGGRRSGAPLRRGLGGVVPVPPRARSHPEAGAPKQRGRLTVVTA